MVLGDPHLTSYIFEVELCPRSFFRIKHEYFSYKIDKCHEEARGIQAMVRISLDGFRVPWMMPRSVKEVMFC